MKNEIQRQLDDTFNGVFDVLDGIVFAGIIIIGFSFFGLGVWTFVKFVISFLK